MTTPSTPAGWYPDPDGSGGQRYWDGSAWTEHKVEAPSPAEAAPADPEPAAEPEPIDVPSTAYEPTTSFETPSSIDPTPSSDPTPSYAPTSSFETPSYEPTTAFQATPKQPAGGRPADWYTDPNGSGGLRYWDGDSWTEHTAAGQSAAEPTAARAISATEPDWGSSATAPPAAKRPLWHYIVPAVAALTLIVIVAAIIIIVSRDREVTTSVGGSTTTSEVADEETTPETTTTEEETPTAAPPEGEEFRDGNFGFIVNGTERLTTVSDPNNPILSKTAVGEFFIVNLSVANFGTEPQLFLPQFQTLQAEGVSYPGDNEAYVFSGYLMEPIEPGTYVDVPVAFDVPVGSVPDAVDLHDIVGSPGVVVPLA